MRLKKEILVTVSYIVEVDEELLIHGGEHEWKERIEKPLDKRFPRKIKVSDGIWAKWEKNSMITLDSANINSARCASCGAWVTDRSKPDCIELCAGKYVGGAIYCAECAADMIARVPELE